MKFKAQVNIRANQAVLNYIKEIKEQISKHLNDIIEQAPPQQYGSLYETFSSTSSLFLISFQLIKNYFQLFEQNIVNHFKTISSQKKRIEDPFEKHVRQQIQYNLDDRSNQASSSEILLIEQPIFINLNNDQQTLEESLQFQSQQIHQIKNMFKEKIEKQLNRLKLKGKIIMMRNLGQIQKKRQARINQQNFVIQQTVNQQQLPQSNYKTLAKSTMKRKRRIWMKKKTTQKYVDCFNFSTQSWDVDEDVHSLKIELLKQIRQINNMKQELKVFQKPQKGLWFANKNNKQIQQLIYLIYSRIDVQIKLAQIKKYKELILKIWFDKKKICILHEQQIYYYLEKQQLKQSLCNICISQIQESESHQQIQVGCIKHADIIRYKYRNQLQNNRPNYKAQIAQYFFCILCVNQINFKKQNTILITTCHFEPIEKICLQGQCIKANNFIICRRCKNQRHHSQHKTINFAFKSLEDQFKIQNDQKIEYYESLLQKSMQMIQLREINKVLNNYMTDIWPIIKILQSYGIWRNQQLHKWIKIFLQEGLKEDLYVLWGVGQLKQKNYGQYEKFCCLQVFSDQFLKQQLNLFESFSLSLKKLHQNMANAFNYKNTEINNQLNGKYSNFKSTRINGKQFQPQKINIQQLSITNLKRIRNIEIKQYNLRMSSNIIYKWRSKRINFFNHGFWEKIKHFEISKQQKNYIFNKLVKDGKKILKFTKMPIEYKYHVLAQLLKQQQKVYAQERASRQSSILLSFLQNKLTNLQRISLEYRLDLTINSHISAFKLFKIVFNNEQLEQLNIKGIALFHFQQFLTYLRVIRNQLPKMFINKDENTINDIIIDENGMKHYALDQQWKTEVEWIQKSNINPLLKISIPVVFHALKIDSNKYLENLSFYVSTFQSISNIHIIINFDEQVHAENIQNSCKQLAEYFHLLKKTGNLNIWIFGRKQGQKGTTKFIAKEILKILAQIKSITSLGLEQIHFQGQNQEDLNKIEMDITNIFNNNKILQLILQNCYNIPLNVRTQTLQKVIINKTTLNRGSEFIKFLFEDNKCLRRIQISVINDFQKTDWRLLYNIEMASFTSQIANKIPFASILHLKLENQKDGIINSSSLSTVFPELKNLLCLVTKHISFRGEMLLKIPSQSLQQLKIFKNKQITSYCFEKIDLRWPQLVSIGIWNCQKLSNDIFTICKFKGLCQLDIDPKIINNQIQLLKRLKKRGIKILDSMTVQIYSKKFGRKKHLTQISFPL